ncbi:MAG TPA: RNA polymerase sigma factor, partial [Nannocystaceae bacterium]|nr:RNA polymerase sigma factor [Nannocystaceae bacterium]
MSLDERIDDIDLLRNWRAGDARAGDRLLARHFGAVYRFFRGKTGSAAEALAQATFVGCRDADPPAGDVAFKAQLFTIARRRLLDHLAQATTVAIDPTARTLAALVRDRVQDSPYAPLFELPIDVQIAIELHHWERLSVADVGHVIGLGAGAVKGRLARVRKQLDAKVLRGPAALLDADGQRAWASVRARVFEAPTRTGFSRYRVVERIDH